MSAASEDPYLAFLDEQRIREKEWSAKRKAKRSAEKESPSNAEPAKKGKLASGERDCFSSPSNVDPATKGKSASGEVYFSSEVDILKEKLESKTRESAMLKDRLLQQENICKVSRWL